MADEQKNNGTPAPAPQPVAGGEGEPGPVPYERFKETNEALKKLQAQMDELTKNRQSEEEAKLAEQKKWEELAKKREEELKAERGERLRLEISTKIGLPLELAGRLRGETPAELESDAKALAELLKPREGPGVPPVNGNGRGNKPMDLSRMSPQEIRENAAKILDAQ